MINEVLQWMVLVALGLLTLGLYRQYATAIGIGDSQQLPGTMGPKAGRSLSASHLVKLGLNGRGGLVFFVSDTCASCHRLLAQLERADAESALPPVTIVAVASAAQFVDELRRLPATVVDDTAANLATELKVSATPFVLSIDAKGAVRAKAVENDLERVLKIALTTT